MVIKNADRRVVWDMNWGFLINAALNLDQQLDLRKARSAACPDR